VPLPKVHCASAPTQPE